MSKKIKISFEITDVYNTEGFRNFIKFLMSDDNFDVYIISNHETGGAIIKVGEILGLPDDHVITTNFNEDKLDAIKTNNINIHFDNLQSFILFVDETTDAYGILVNGKWNTFYNKSDYLVVFERILKKVQDEQQE